MRPNKKAELANWIRRQLGEPVVRTSELDSAQLEDCIEMAIDYFTEFSGGIGHEEQYCVIQSHSCEELKQVNPQYDICSVAVTGTPFSFCEPERITSEYLTYRHEYQLPKNVLAVQPPLQNSSMGMGGLNWLTQGRDIIDSALRNAENMSSNYGGSFLGGGSVNTSTSSPFGFFFPGIFASGGAYGTRGGMRGGGWGPDLVTYQLGLQYMEMLNQMFRVRINVQFLEAERKVRISPPPRMAGLFILPVWARVADEYLYDQMWIKRYSLACAKKQIGINVLKYEGMKLPGGVSINGRFYYDEGVKEIEKLEKEIDDNKYGYPPHAFFVG